jgi:hypothetical protein
MPAKELLVEPRHALLVAGEAVERFGDDDLKPAPASVLQQLLVARPKRRGAADRGV